MVHHAYTLITLLSKRHEELTKYLGKRDHPSLPNLITLPRQPVPPSRSPQGVETPLASGRSFEISF